MLRSANDILGYKVDAEDGTVGTVHDFFFDDVYWVVRYLVVDTGTWLSGRRVLVSPLSIEGAHWASRSVSVGLTRDKIREGPGIETDAPVSRQKEAELATYYGWPAYWGPFPTLVEPPADVTAPTEDEPETPPDVNTSEPSKGDPHLRSVREVTGYDLEADDGEIGHVEDFIVNDEGWTIRYMVVDTRSWLPGRKVLIALGWIVSFSWDQRKARVSLTRDRVKDSPEYDSSAPVNREYEMRLYDYYGRPLE
jgi:uncharacterized protein YrrD